MQGMIQCQSYHLKDKGGEKEKLHTELVQYCLMSSLMAISFLCNLGPVWYHPTILSLAVKH